VGGDDPIHSFVDRGQGLATLLPPFGEKKSGKPGVPLVKEEVEGISEGEGDLDGVFLHVPQAWKKEGGREGGREGGTRDSACLHVARPKDVEGIKLHPQQPASFLHLHSGGGGRA
jgi:hypothetical protein